MVNGTETKELAKYNIGWELCGKMVDRLAKKIKDQNVAFDAVVGIARGGLPFAVALSHIFKKPFDSMYVKSYDETDERGSISLLNEPRIDLNNKRILLVDDIVDSGETIKYAKEYLIKSRNANYVILAAPLMKPWAGTVPNLYLESTDKWVVFPWEKGPEDEN